jgi:hypothetical protein
MMDKPRFTLMLMLIDNNGFEQPLRSAIGCDQALRISSRAVSELKMSVDLGIPSSCSIEIIKTKEMRRSLFKMIAQQLAGQMADRMEDAEGWHDPERIEAARRDLGRNWE